MDDKTRVERARATGRRALSVFDDDSLPVALHPQRVDGAVDLPGMKRGSRHSSPLATQVATQGVRCHREIVGASRAQEELAPRRIRSGD